MTKDEKVAAARQDAVRGLFDELLGDGAYAKATGNASRSVGQLDHDVKVLHLATAQVAITLDTFLTSLNARGVKLTETCDGL